MLLVSDIIYCSETTTLMSKEGRGGERERSGKKERKERDMYDTMTTNYMRDVILQKIKWSMCVCA